MMTKGEQTKHRILDEALNLFSIKGYSAVSVRDISKAAGIKESSIYNHFVNKQDILDKILEAYAQDLENFMITEKIMLPGNHEDQNEQQADYFSMMSEELFVGLAMKVFEKMFLDERINKLWRLLSIERFNNSGIDDLYKKLIFNDALKYQGMILSLMMEKGLIRKADPEMLAIEFFAPAYLLYQRYFASGNEAVSDEEKKKAEQLFIQHVLHFRESNK